MSDTLFELEPADLREGADVTHVLMPDMSYACGGSILTKRGHFRVGAAGDNWALIACPDCRAFGQEVLVDESRQMQGRQAGVT